MQVVIPAAGLGSRFLPITHVVPKELLPLGEWPLLHHALREAEAAGFEQATVVIAPEKSAIRRYFEPDPGLERLLESREDYQGLRRLRSATGLALRMHLRFVQCPPTGIGGAVLAAADAGIAAPFAVLLPDDVVPTVRHWRQLIRLHRETGAAVIAVREVDWSQTDRFGIAECDPEDGHLRVRGLVEKPAITEAPSNLSIFGRYIITEPVLRALRELATERTSSSSLAGEGRGGGVPRELQLTDGLGAVVEQTPGVIAIEFTDTAYDCGTPPAYAVSMGRYQTR
jgi:UTP--glucose-1-phosphate uridylyltransferase